MWLKTQVYLWISIAHTIILVTFWYIWNAFKIKSLPHQKKKNKYPIDVPLLRKFDTSDFFFLNLGMRINDEKELLRDWLKVPVLENYFHLIFQDQI